MRSPGVGERRESYDSKSKHNGERFLPKRTQYLAAAWLPETSAENGSLAHRPFGGDWDDCYIGVLASIAASPTCEPQMAGNCCQQSLWLDFFAMWGAGF
jgi:hypothetical protein